MGEHVVKPEVDTRRAVDFSFMPSLQCDLECVHCMYSSGPYNTAELDLEKTMVFIDTVDWGTINSCGFYGGEPGIKIPLYNQFISLIPRDTPRFIITDGTWSRTKWRTNEFVEFAIGNKLQVFISATPYHTPHQNLKVITETCERFPSFMVKGDDKIIPMGRAALDTWKCSFRCLWDERPLRFALKPGGAIMFQSCDGIYPTVQTYEESFSHLLETYTQVITRCQKMREFNLLRSPYGVL